MDIETFNAAERHDAEAALRPCARIERWVGALVDDRPYTSVESLLDHAAALAATWDGVDLVAALADHPRIGERHGGDGAGAAMSEREQAGTGLDAAGADAARRLVEGNRAYEAIFGRIYLVRAKWRTGEEILALLEDRLDNDPATELEVTLGQLREIALLRLEETFAVREVPA